MSDLNQWQGVGRLGSDPEIKYTAGGTAVLNVSIACDDSYKDKQTGQKVYQTEWVSLVAFGKTAEFLGEYLRKGARLLAVGKLKTRSWEKDGVKHYKTEVHLERGTQVIDWPPKDGAAGPDSARRPPQQRQQSTPASQQPAPPNHDSFDDDIPFAGWHSINGM